jgi:HK97 family phage portal protein
MSLVAAQSALARVSALADSFRDADMNNLTAGGYSLENPRTSWDRIFEVEPTFTGKQVTEASALQSAAVWACVRIISSAIGKIPLTTYRQTDDGKERATNHYLWNLLRRAPNPYMTAFRFKRMMQAWALLWGNAYAEIEISANGRVVGLWPWRPDRVRVCGDVPLTDAAARDSGMGLFYSYRLNDGTEVTLPGHNILHIRGLETDGVMGLGPIKVARQTVGLDQAAQEYGARFFDNNGRPGGFLTTANKLGSEGRKNLRESFEDLHRGLRGAHRIAILEEGLKYQDVGIPPEDMQFLQTRQFQAIDIARLFGVPPHKIAELSRATFSNIEHQSIEFIQDCLGDWFENWEQEIECSLLSAREASTIFVEFNADYLMRGDILSRYRSYSLGRMGGWLSVNDVREKENMNRIEGGDRYMEPLNMQDVAEAAGGETDPEGNTAGDVDDDQIDQADVTDLARSMAFIAAKRFQKRIALKRATRRLAAAEPEPIEEGIEA